MEKDGVLKITQSIGPALRNLRNMSRSLLVSAVPLLLWYMLFPESIRSWCRVMLTGPGAGMMVLFVVFFVLVTLFELADRFFGKETFVFDRNSGVFIRNGFTVCALHEIRAVTAQVGEGSRRSVMFRLALELPRYETVTIVRTHDVPGLGEFRLSGNGLGDPNTRFPAGTPWLNYEEQNVVPFFPREIADLRRKILEYAGEASPVPHL